VVNFFATHLQAWDTPEGRRIRSSQAKECSQFIKDLNIPKDEPVIFGGDLNLDLYNQHTELQKLMSEMNLTMVPLSDGAFPFTSDPRNNSMVGNDETIKYATDEWPQGCYEEYIRTMSCPCCPREMLDYIAWSHEHMHPKEAQANIVILKSDDVFDMHFNIKTRRVVNDLSDHFPVVATFMFPHVPLGLKNRTILYNKTKSLIETPWYRLTLYAMVVCIAIMFVIYTIVKRFVR
jgi:endonuclease/exonuclease/phosphatase family metal-dependent hydrolase